MTEFGADEIRIGELLHRSVAHLAAACELYGMGRKAEALLQAARPITDVLPALETELRSAGDELNDFFAATAQVGADIRGNAKPRALRRALGKLDRAAQELLGATVGEAATMPEPHYRASVGVALLDRARDRYQHAVENENLGDYQAAYAIADRATDLIFEAHDGRNAELNELVRALSALLPSVEPPEKLPRPEALETLIEGVAAAAVEDLGAQRVTWTLADSLQRIERLLGDVTDAYEKDLGPLAARLAATLFVRAYDPVRRDVASVDPDGEARLTALLGFELRTAINEGAPAPRVNVLAAEARGLLVTVRERLITQRDLDEQAD